MTQANKTAPDGRFAVTVSLIKAGLYKGKVVRSTVVDTMEFELDGPEVQEVVDSFCADRGITPPKRWERQGELRQATLGLSVNEADLLQVLITTPQPVKSPEQLEMERIEQEEGAVLAKTYRKWRVKLDALKRRKTELDALGGVLDAVQHAEMQQLTGAINLLSGVLTDLQMVRPVNQSALNR